MANNAIGRLLELSSVQMAAEAFLLRSPDNGAIPTDRTEITTRLEEGNKHASKFMPVQASAFTDSATGYKVVAQKRNDPEDVSGTGFSATLFKKKVYGSGLAI